MKKPVSNLLIALIPLLTISFVSKIAPYIYIPSLPDIAGHFSLNQSQAGSTVSVYYLSLSLTLLVAGVVGDVWDKKRLLTGASIVIFLGAVISSVASQFGFMLSGWALQAVGAATITIVGQAWIGQSSNKKNITSLFSYLTIIIYSIYMMCL